jgi:hypothetical protein
MADSALDHDERLRRPAGIRSVRLRDTKVSFVPDGAVQLTPRGWLPDTTDEIWSAHPQYLDASGNLVASIGGLLVESGDRTLLIDAGFGPQSLPAEPGKTPVASHGSGAGIPDMGVVRPTTARASVPWNSSSRSRASAIWMSRPFHESGPPRTMAR